ncbi:MAG: hypothetical protein IKG21_03490 [Atopobiaceae bacterium]|nr:hypothetical protein [Atopobiaceae bacterium]
MESSASRYASRCVVCGKPARVSMGASAYCLDCYNRLTDYLAGVETPTNDNYSILALDPNGRTVEFAVERFAFGTSSTWTAVEQVADDDPRKEWGYVGRSISIAADARLMTQEQALDALMVKVQQLVGHAGMRPMRIPSGQIWETSARREGQVLSANETGVARITCDAHGEMSFVVDGQSLTPDQFADFMSCFEGFDLYWQVRDASDEPPDWL